MFLIDTDVLPALRKRKDLPDIAQRVDKQPSADLYRSVVSVGEIQRGIERQQRRDPVYARTLAAWLDSLLRALRRADSRGRLVGGAPAGPPVRLPRP